MSDEPAVAARKAASYFARNDRDREIAERWVARGSHLQLPTHGIVKDEHGARDHLFLVTGGCLAPMLSRDPQRRGYHPAVFGSVLYESPPDPNYGGIFGSLEVRAISPTSVWRIPRDHHRSMFEVPGFLEYMYHRVICTNAFVRNLLALHATSSGRVAVARILVMLGGFIGRRVDGILVIGIQQEYLGGLAGVTRRTANKLLADMKAAGEIEISQELICILNEDALLRHADLPRPDGAVIETATDS